jgi:PQQ-dependent catabolism-associated CXXCW motif protein
MLDMIGREVRPVVASLLVVFLLLSAGVQSAWAAATEPAGLWTGPMRGETPETLKGAVVIDLSGLEVLLAKKPVLLDVGLADKKPEGFPENRLWLPTHRSIPGAMWFPGAGAGELSAEQENVLLRRVEELTQGDRSTSIVTFCRPQCWGSWNVAKRLVMKGYTGVHWFPGGIDQWQEAHDAMEVEPDMAWPSDRGL